MRTYDALLATRLKKGISNIKQELIDIYAPEGWTGVADEMESEPTAADGEH